MKTRINKIGLSGIMFLMLFLMSCSYDIVVPEIIIGEIYSFSTDIIPIFNESCNIAGCHSTGSTAPDLTPDNAYDQLFSGSYIDTLSPENSELYLWVIGMKNTPMPPEIFGGSDPIINAKILAWIDQGAKNN